MAEEHRNEEKKPAPHRPPNGTLRPESPSPAPASGVSGFSRDFLTGCLALLAIGLIGFVLVPLLILVLKISAALVLPLAVLAIAVLLTAYLGRIINVVRRRW